MTPPQALRNAIYRRARYTCERCGAEDGLELHTRPTYTPAVWAPADLVLLCHACEDWLGEHPLTAVAEGWTVPINFETKAVPVLAFENRQLCLLAITCTYRPLVPA
jgi:hypothetical protein